MLRSRLISSDRIWLFETNYIKLILNLIYRLLCLIILLYFVYVFSEKILSNRCDKHAISNNNHPSNEKHKYDKFISDRGNDNNCNTIHLASVCGGFNSTRNFYVLLKSILFYRSQKIHLHLLVDNESRIVLSELFKSWQVSDLQFTFYTASDYEHEISWIPSGHYSQHFGLMKLIFPTILAEKTNLDSIVMIDTDMIVIGDIANILIELKKFLQDQIMFAMVENQSDWYTGENKALVSSFIVWPALRKGFNSGIILINLKQVRLKNWHKIWRDVAERELFILLSAPLADQDIYNAVFKSNPDLIKNLPCTFNLQLNDHTQLNKSCPESVRLSTNEFRIIHWNSPNKYKSKNAMADYYYNWFKTFRNWNGDLLKQNGCIGIRKFDDRQVELTIEPTKKLDRVCKDMRPKMDDILRTHLYYMDYDHQVTDWDVTYVVHFSFDRLQVLDELASHWFGPISAAVYLSEQDTDLFINSIENSINLSRRRNIAYHIVYRDSNDFNYPINRLRNTALNNSLTPFVVLSDIDLLPSYNLYEYLKETLKNFAYNSTAHNHALDRKAFVIPAFESTQYKYEFPQSKEELIKQYNFGTVTMFREELWPRGHRPSDYSRWKISTQPYRVNWRPDYEPFVVTRRDVARYDERFVGFGFNKVEHIMELAALDYEFIVLPEVFLIHKFHPPSYDITRHRNSSVYKQCIKLLERQFLIELNQRKPNFFKKLNNNQQEDT